MRSIKALILISLIGTIPFLTGCAGFSSNPTPAGVGLGQLVGDVTYPNYVGSQTRINLDTDDFEIIQTVSATTTSKNILGLVSEGDNGYKKLFEEARAAGADDVMNIKVDTRKVRYVGFLYTEAHVMLTGVAIKYKK